MGLLLFIFSPSNIYSLQHSSQKFLSWHLMIPPPDYTLPNLFTRVIMALILGGEGSCRASCVLILATLCVHFSCSSRSCGKCWREQRF